MAFDTFDEGINPGGMRSKNEIKTLICYLYNSVKENIDKGIVIQAILKQGLANYFEFDPTLVRVAYVLLSVCTAFSGTLAYILLWIVMPKERV